MLAPMAGAHATSAITAIGKSGGDGPDSTRFAPGARLKPTGTNRTPKAAAGTNNRSSASSNVRCGATLNNAWAEPKVRKPPISDIAQSASRRRTPGDPHPRAVERIHAIGDQVGREGAPAAGQRRGLGRALQHSHCRRRRTRARFRSRSAASSSAKAANGDFRRMADARSSRDMFGISSPSLPPRRAFFRLICATLVGFWKLDSVFVPVAECLFPRRSRATRAQASHGGLVGRSSLARSSPLLQAAPRGLEPIRQPLGQSRQSFHISACNAGAIHTGPSARPIF
ncbi:hypothetical protein FG93_05066 [Bosea sp. LC85]|nr:hypothetical protein FG93_05066 [Bosea sp. LC85]